jgi:hypothetical protein
MKIRPLSVSFGVLLVAGAALAQTPPTPADGDVRAELAKLNQAVREIAALLAKQTEGQKLELLMKRVELASSRAGASEARLRSLQSEKTNLEEERVQFEARTKEITERLESETSETARTEMEMFLRRSQAEGKRLAGRLQSVSQEVSELENLVASQREEAREWQRTLDRRLSGF